MKRPGMDLRETLARLKAESGMTTFDLSEESGVPRGTLNKLLNGETKNPRAGTLQQLADALGCPLEALCGAAEGASQLQEDGDERPGLDTVLLARRARAARDAAAALPEHDFTFVMRGGAMSGARVADGDTVFVRRARDAADGRVVCVRLDGQQTLRRLYHLPGALALVADDPATPPRVVPEGGSGDFEMLGEAVAFQSVL